MNFQNFLASLLAFLIMGAGATPIDSPQPPVDPSTRSDFNDTSIASTNSYKEVACSVIFTDNQVKSGIVGERFRWRNGFFVHPERRFSQQEMNIINDALFELSRHLCIPVKIWPQNSNPTGDYVEIVRGVNTGCNSYVGRLGGKQILNLQYNGCIHKHVVQHELIHALGFTHEQNRPDRDSFVNIFFQNIKPEYRFAFNKQPSYLTFGVPYDYYSIMHYNSKDFSSNGQYTILAKNGQTVGSQGKLTSSDISKLRRMYNC